jgi:hypothetical protein
MLSDRYISSHPEALYIRVNEVTRPRPDHGKDRQLHALAHGAHQVFGWSEPAQAQVRAEFDAMRAAALGSNGCRRAFYRYLKKD